MLFLELFSGHRRRGKIAASLNQINSNNAVRTPAGTYQFLRTAFVLSQRDAAFSQGLARLVGTTLGLPPNSPINAESVESLARTSARNNAFSVGDWNIPSI